MPVIGLTGGIATGKSLVTDYLKSKGFAVIDADQLARDAVRKGEPAYGEVVDLFGSGILHDDGTLHREKLAGIVFHSPEKRKRLEAIIHPRVYEAAWKEIRKIQGEDAEALIFFSVPLLFETGHHREVDKVAVVYADELIQIERLIKRNGLTEEEAVNRISTQISIEVKRKAADFVIHNTGLVRETLQKMEEFLTALQS